jgi:hypothetical protein
VLDVHWCTFEALVGVWILNIWSIGVVQVTFQDCKCFLSVFDVECLLMQLSIDLSWLSAIDYFLE